MSHLTTSRGIAGNDARTTRYPDDAFDLIVCALAIHYASDRQAACAEFCRVLRPGGAAVVSTQHPVMDWLRKGGSYFETTLETDIWHTPSGDQSMPLP